LQQLAAAIVRFDVFFEVRPGTKAPSVAPDLNDFEVGGLEIGHE